MESFYVLWRTTGDEVWRERGWKVFEAIEKHTKTASGYASLNSVYRLPAWQKDEMPRCVLTCLISPRNRRLTMSPPYSFFTAET